MADDNSTKGGIPAWQRPKPEERSNFTKPDQSQPPKPQSQSEPQDAAKASDETSADSAKGLVDQAARFLDDDRIRNSSDQDKIEFLESKGLSKEDIDRVMSRPKEQTAIAPRVPSAPRTPAVPSREPAPIITYPEFMVHSQKPPPIITGQRLLNTAYVAAGLTALIYGASRYLVQPMFESLTAARHDFAAHSKEHIDKLNERLEAIVSVDPRLAGGARSINQEEEDLSSDSDPTELFHRDFGTQTSPELEKNASDSSSSTEGGTLDAVDWQNTKIQRLQAICEDISNEEKSEADTAKEVSNVIRIVSEQLEGLSVPANTFSTYGAYESARIKKDDEISKMKAEIRQVKGALLNARNFPGGRR